MAGQDQSRDVPYAKILGDAGGRTVVADETQFGHDRLGHLLEDQLLKVPRFQRSYAWDESNIDEFLNDLTRAQQRKDSYFMGTVVLADDDQDPSRRLVVDGQQRLTTAAILLAATRDRLRELGKEQAAESVDSTYLRTFELDQETTVLRLVVSSTDVPTYHWIVGYPREDSSPGDTKLFSAYMQCKEFVTDLASGPTEYRELIDLVAYLRDRVQVLTAVASGIPEAFVIFETLNDRGADLTTADLLKNYLFSEADTSTTETAQDCWTRIAGTFDRAEDLVKFIRYEHSARKGKVTNRKLYRALQEDIGSGSASVLAYLTRLERSLEIYLALRDPDSTFWSDVNFDIRTSLMAFRRFGFESSTPLLIAAITKLGSVRGARIVNKVAAWSIRAMMAGKLGGGQAEEIFCQAAVAVSSGRVQNQAKIREILSPLIPDNHDFRQAFLAFGPMTTTKAKYILSQLERQYAIEQGANIESLPDWSSRTVTVDHIFPKSSKRESFSSDEEYESFLAMCNQVQNLTLLERSLNKDADDKSFSDKASILEMSNFALTKKVGKRGEWNLSIAEERRQELADLAVKAWSR